MKHGLECLTKSENDAKGSLELSLYCDYFLRLLENGNTFNFQKKMNNMKLFYIIILKDDEEPSKKESILCKCDNIKKEFPLIIVKELLNAIKLNSYEARQRFPRLLQIVETYYDQTLDCFIKSVK